MEEMQMVEQQFRQMQQIIESLDEQLKEVEQTRNSLQEFAGLHGDEEVFFPLASGIFVKGKLSDNKIVRMNVGSDVVVEKTIEDAIALMQRQYSDMNDYKEQLKAQMELLLKKLQD